MGTIILGFVTAFFVVLLSTPALIRVSFMKELVDEPGDERKLHKVGIPTIGGIMIFAGTLFSYFLWYPFGDITEYQHLIHAINDFKYIGASMLILFFIGVKDDIVGTAPVKKLAGHLIVAFILVVMAGIRLTSMHGIFGITEIPMWASILLSVFTYTVIVNAFNLIDGVDGLAAGIGAIVCIAYGVWFYLAGGIENACLSFALAGALVGFLIFNFAPAKIFMGDSGSLTIGLIVSVLSIKLIEFDNSELPLYMRDISKPVFVLAVLVYPMIDTLRIFIYRTVKGLSPFAPDKNHIHHRLLDHGFGHAGTVVVLYLFSLLIIGLTLLIKLDPSYSFLIIGGIAVTIIQIPFLFKTQSQKRKKDLIHEFRIPEKEKIRQN